LILCRRYQSSDRGVPDWPSYGLLCWHLNAGARHSVRQQLSARIPTRTCTRA
jgi:hypothetical protein